MNLILRRPLIASFVRPVEAVAIATSLSIALAGNIFLIPPTQSQFFCLGLWNEETNNCSFK